MITIVAISINGTVVRVQCDGLARDAHLSRNIVLTGCRELDTEAPDGRSLETKIWSVPESMVLSYAVGSLPAPPPAPAVNVDPTANMTPEELKAHRERRRKVDAAARERRLAERKARAAVVPPPVEAVTPVEKPAPRVRKPKAPKAP